jgi:hypothetical protein
MIFSASLSSPWTKMSHDGNKERSSRRSLQNKMVRIKAWVRMTKYHLIQKTQGISCNVTFTVLRSAPAATMLPVGGRGEKTNRQEVE